MQWLRQRYHMEGALHSCDYANSEDMPFSCFDEQKDGDSHFQA